MYTSSNGLVGLTRLVGSGSSMCCIDIGRSWGHRKAIAASLTSKMCHQSTEMPTLQLDILGGCGASLGPSTQRSLNPERKVGTRAMKPVMELVVQQIRVETHQDELIVGLVLEY